jgi:enhancer of yellow 2 transcription factor
LIRNKGLEKINLDDLVEELLPKGRALVPTKVKEDLLARIKSYLESDSDYKRLTGY